jgi:hypothetical protein
MFRKSYLPPITPSDEEGWSNFSAIWSRRFYGWREPVSGDAGGTCPGAGCDGPPGSSTSGSGCGAGSGSGGMWPGAGCDGPPGSSSSSRAWRGWTLGNMVISVIAPNPSSPRVAYAGTYFFRRSKRSAFAAEARSARPGKRKTAATIDVVITQRLTVGALAKALCGSELGQFRTERARTSRSPTRLGERCRAR